MSEKELSRRDVLKLAVFGGILIGTASTFEACGITPPSVKPNATKTLEPEITPSPTPEPTPTPSTEPSPAPELTPKPNPKPTSKPIIGRWIKYQGPEVVWHGDRSKSNVYLTMDDCWSIKNVEKALKTANDNEIKMTFCPVGKVISRNPGMYKEIISEGHDVQNHTYNHQRLDTKTKQQIKKEILKARDALWNAVEFEYPQHFIRPPGEFGVTGVRIWEPLFDAAEELDYKVLVWDISSGGTGFGAFTAEPKQIAKVEKNVETHMHNGGISLQHAIDVDVAAFPHIVSFVKRNGWNPITIRQGLG